MVAPAIPLIYWGLGILLAGGSVAAYQRYREEDIDLGKIELPEVLQGGPEPEPEPELDPERRLPDGITRTVARQALQEMVRTQTRLRRRCQDEEEQDCPYCKPAVDGKAVMTNVHGGTVRKASPKARGALYQHYVAPWHLFTSEEEDGGVIRIRIEEWDWKRGKDAAWDALDYGQCKLYECKLGYRDWLDESLLAPVALGDPMPSPPPYMRKNPKKPWLPTLFDEWEDQIRSQYLAFVPDWPTVTLEWVFSDNDVMWQFLGICIDLGFTEIGSEHTPFHLAPSGTNFIRELYETGEQDYGYWEDV